jgi:hypothetical protein
LSTVSLLLADVPSATILPVRPWPDPVIDALGHDPRSAYVERFWLGILGPSTTPLRSTRTPTPMTGREGLPAKAAAARILERDHQR